MGAARNLKAGATKVERFNDSGFHSIIAFDAVGVEVGRIDVDVIAVGFDGPIACEVGFRREKGVDITGVEEVVAVAAQHGVNSATLAAALADPAVKEKLKAEVDASLAAGVFGSPYIVVDGEAFWGSDRLDQIEAWLAHGAW